MTQEEKRKLGQIIALAQYCEDYLESYKKQIRKMTNEDIELLNENTFFEVSRGNYTVVTYPEEYKAEEKELKEKYKDKIIKDTKENYSVKLKATNYSKQKTSIIVNNILNCTKKELQNMIANKVRK